MNTSSRIALVVAALASGPLACSSQSGIAANGNGPDASHPDAGEQSDSAGDDGGAKDAHVDAALSEAATCPSIVDACVDGGPLADQCVESWSTAQQPSTWCPQFPYARIVRATDCDGFDIVVIGATDTSSFYYYDPQSGALVGIEGHGGIATRCVAGRSPNVSLLDCYEAGAAMTFVCQSDGGVSD